MTEVIGRQPSYTLLFRRPGKAPIVITANPMNIEHALKTNFENYVKGYRSISVVADFLGQGIFNSDGELWKVQRKTASFEFNTKSLRNFVMDAVRYEIRDRLLPLLTVVAEAQTSLDLQDALERFAFDNVCKVAFNEDPGCLAADDAASESGVGREFARAFELASSLIAGRFMYALPFLWKIKKFLNVGSERRLKESISIVHDFAVNIIRSRKEKMEKENSALSEDLLSRFMANYYTSEEFLRDIIVSFILAGRDTTSSSLAWFFWLLSTRPDVERKIVEEVKAVRSRHPDTGETFSYDELREMNYLHAALSESMRLYPPVAINSRTALEDDILPDGTFVRKGWVVSYHAYSMGRMEGVWGPDCRNFVPDRWLEKGVFRPESPSKYPMFHAGPRMCLGKEMAYIQMKSIAASVLERFEIDALDKENRPQPILSLTMRMRDGLPVRVRKRP
ncbi:cytochrome P450 CYP94D108-like [Aristolochia californica]|uniref:cytochrome P450 CYP94D108-like n=1 Tax=Aristolochia californica TaxID=171875 RepID=UPI0035DEC7D3